MATTVARAPASTRILSLDVLRGIAILGTLATNVWIFTDPEGLVGYIDGTAVSGAWGWTEKALQQLAQGKFLGLLTIMFGIGLAIQQRSAQRRGERWPGPYPWRAALLFADGVVHFVLVAEFDVLMGYAITGLVVAFLLATSERTQRRWMISALTVHVVLLTGVSVAILAAPDSGPSNPLDPNPYAHGSWWELAEFRLDNAALFRLEPIFVLAMSIGLFLAGARLYRAGVLGPNGGAIRRRLILAGALAWPVDMALGCFGGDAGLILARYGTASVVALGILGAVAEFYDRRDRVGFVGRRLSDVGRMALSGYILQNIVASTICYGWGFGLAQRVDGPARIGFTIGVYAGVCVVVLTFAHVWLRRFARGPVEWLWNTGYQAIVRTR